MHTYVSAARGDGGGRRRCSEVGGWFPVADWCTNLPERAAVASESEAPNPTPAASTQPKASAAGLLQPSLPSGPPCSPSIHHHHQAAVPRVHATRPASARELEVPHNNLGPGRLARTQRQGIVLGGSQQPTVVGAAFHPPPPTSRVSRPTHAQWPCWLTYQELGSCDPAGGRCQRRAAAGQNGAMSVTQQADTPLWAWAPRKSGCLIRLHDHWFNGQFPAPAEPRRRGRRCQCPPGLAGPSSRVAGPAMA